ncbi:MAG: hypothetical protein AAB410_01715 [Patescibacteria group bacterium]
MKTTIHLKVDPEIKIRAAALAERLGLSLSTVVNASLRSFVQTETFSVSASEPMTPYMENWIGEIENDIAADKNIIGPFQDAAAMDKALKKYLKKK